MRAPHRRGREVPAPASAVVRIQVLVVRRIEPQLFAQAGIVAGASAAIGVLAGIKPTFAIGAAFAMAFLLVALADLGTGLVVFVLMIPLGLAPGFGSAVNGFAKLAGLVLALSWLAQVVQSRRSDDLLWDAHPILTWAVTFFVVWTVLSLTWADVGSGVVSSAERVALNAFLLVIVYTAVRDRVTLRRVLLAIVAGAALSAAYGIVSPPTAESSATGDIDRLSGTIGDPNQLAAMLVVGFVLAVGLFLTARHAPFERLAVACAGGLALLGLFLTVSRGGLIALAAGVIVAIVIARGYRLPAFAAALVIVAVGVGYFSYFAPQSSRDRISNGDGGSGRTDVWTVGWRMVEAHPVHGIGAGNFEFAAPQYLLVAPGLLPRAQDIVETPKVAHNTYLGILAELGVIGLGLFLILVAACLLAALKAAREFARLGDDSMEILSRALVVALAALLAADFFLWDEFNKQLWLMLALCPAVLAIAKRSAAEEAQSV
jgi:O-antigen ligase